MFPTRSDELRETAALVALLRRAGRTRGRLVDRVEEAGSATAVLARGPVGAGTRGTADERAAPLFATESTPTGDAPDLDAIVAEIRGWRADGIRALSVLDDDYPSNLRTIHNRPPLLFVRGRLSAADARAIAVIGTRRASIRGLAAATAIAGDLAERGFTITSGLATGIDTAAHRAALACGRRTVAVIGTGVRRAYPPENAGLQRQIAAEGAVISQFWPDAPPCRRAFPQRNIVMSGLSLATVVIEASHISGARMQARVALEQGRPVFLLTSLLAHDWAQDCAARPGAHVVDSADEIAAHVERLTGTETVVARASG